MCILITYDEVKLKIFIGYNLTNLFLRDMTSVLPSTFPGYATLSVWASLSTAWALLRMVWAFSSHMCALSCVPDPLTGG